MSKIIGFNSFFDCNYSSLILRSFDRALAITFKNKLIYEDASKLSNKLSNKYVASVELGCYSLSIEAVKRV